MSHILDQAQLLPQARGTCCAAGSVTPGSAADGRSTYTHTIPWMLQGAGGGKGVPSTPVDPETLGPGSQTTPACCKKTKWVRIIKSRHIFAGLETVSSEVALKDTGPFCSFPGGWRLFGWRRAEWEQLRSNQISEMLMRWDHLFCVFYSAFRQLLFSTENVYVYSGKRLVLKRCAFNRKPCSDQQLMSSNTVLLKPVVLHNSHL